MVAQPNVNRELDILVVDPNREIWEAVCTILGRQEKSRWNMFRPKLVARAGHARDRIKRGVTPSYAGVLYAPGSLKGEAKTVGSIQGRAPLMVQVLVEGTRTRFGEDEKRFAATNGAREIAETLDGLVAITKRHFLQPSPIDNATVVKVGGSAFDYQGDMLAADPALQTYAHILQEIFGEKTGKERHRILCTPGAGLRGNIAKAERNTFRDNRRVQQEFPLKMVNALRDNADLLYNLLTDDPQRHWASRRDPRKFYLVNRRNARSKIQVIATAPPYVMVRDNIPYEDSDTHTIALAEFYGIKRVVLLKRTDGIYRFDPLRGYEIKSGGGCRDLGRWIKEQEGNERYQTVTVQEMLDGSFSREGTSEDGYADGTTGHLMEDSALQYFSNCRHVEEILIVHVAPHELYAPTPSGLQHIVTAQPASTATLEEQRRQLLRQAIIHGTANSRIIRETR